MTDAEIIREYYEADSAYRIALAKQIALPEMATLPQDVREAKAHLACADESKRFIAAKIALEEMRADREDRWIVAHEYATAWRREQAS